MNRRISSLGEAEPENHVDRLKLHSDDKGRIRPEGFGFNNKRVNTELMK